MSYTDKLKNKLAEISFNKGGDQVIYLGDAIRTSSSILEEYRKELGKEFKKWFYSENPSEPIEDAIERITGVKVN